MLLVAGIEICTYMRTCCRYSPGITERKEERGMRVCVWDVGMLRSGRVRPLKIGEEEGDPHGKQRGIVRVCMEEGWEADGSMDLTGGNDEHGG